MEKTLSPVRIGILGGTFNPLHLGHLVLAQDALELFGLERILFVPCASPPHKPAEDLAPGADRLAMIEAALGGDPRFSASDIEIRRGGMSYSVDTVREIRNRFPGVEVSFIIGSDSLADLRLWKDIYALLDLCRFVTILRPGADPGSFRDQDFGLRQPWPERLRSAIRAGHAVDISSSDIRKRVREGRSVRYLVHPAVERYLETHSLYKDGRKHGTD